MFEITPGRVSANTSTKTHLILAGNLAYCGSGNGRLVGDTETLTVGNATRLDLCARCATRIRQLLDNRASTAAASPKERYQVAIIREKLRTPAERDADAILLDALAETLRAPVEPAPLTWEAQQAHRAAMLAPIRNEAALF